jgi:hypothetical protein
VRLLLSFLFQPIDSVGFLLFIRPLFWLWGEKKLHTKKENLHKQLTLDVIIPALSQESHQKAHHIGGPLNLPGLFDCQRCDLKKCPEHC